MKKVSLVVVLVSLFIACDSGPVTKVVKSPGGEELEVIRSERFWADPAVVKSCEENVVTTLHWNVPDVETVEIRVAEKNGALFAVSSGAGSKQTERWVKHGMRFFLIEAVSRKVLAEANVLIDRSHCD